METIWRSKQYCKVELVFSFLYLAEAGVLFQAESFLMSKYHPDIFSRCTNTIGRSRNATNLFTFTYSYVLIVSAEKTTLARSLYETAHVPTVLCRAQVAVKVQVRSWDVYWLSLPNRVGLGIICL